ncbi:hypothetical protein [Streptomyces phaeochromogenes]|uniref:hypothetical protein n=1 Tax=Streptomyces phaeochromogenes TaxID=1923 RepID=UPI00386DA08B
MVIFKNPHQRQREAGDWHAQALRHLFNRMLGQLHHCLQNRVHFDAFIAFPPPATTG